MFRRLRLKRRRKILYKIINNYTPTRCSGKTTFLFNTYRELYFIEAALKKTKGARINER